MIGFLKLVMALIRKLFFRESLSSRDIEYTYLIFMYDMTIWFQMSSRFLQRKSEYKK